MSRRRLVARSFVSSLMMLWMISAEAETKRPSRHPDYAEGIRAIRNEQWEEAVPRLRRALEHWQTEDGELTRLYGAWFVPYLPELYLGVALFHLRCYPQAQKHLEKSVLNNKTIRRAEEEQKMLVEYRARVAEQLRLGTSPSQSELCEEAPK